MSHKVCRFSAPLRCYLRRIKQWSSNWLYCIFYINQSIIDFVCFILVHLKRHFAYKVCVVFSILKRHCHDIIFTIFVLFHSRPLISRLKQFCNTYYIFCILKRQCHDIFFTICVLFHSRPLISRLKQFCNTVFSAY